MSDCIFCKIVNGEIPSSTIYEDEEFKVILDVAPVSKGHAVILAKNHCMNLTELPNESAAHLLPLAKRIGMAMMESLDCTGFNLLQNNGIAAGQTVFHFHMHVVPRYGDGADGVTWEQHSVDVAEMKEIAERIKTAI